MCDSGHNSECRAINPRTISQNLLLTVVQPKHFCQNIARKNEYLGRIDKSQFIGAAPTLTKRSL